MTPPAGLLFDSFGTEADEIAVISAIFADPGDSDILLAQASIIIGVDALGLGDWAAWEAMHGRSDLGADPGSAAFALAAAGFVGVRQPVTVQEAEDWLLEVLTTGRSALLGKIPEASAGLSSGSPIFISPHLDADSSQHVSRSVRPGKGVLYPLAAQAHYRYPNHWVDETGRPCFVEGRPLGLNRGGPETVRGLVVMRQSRTAWISGLRVDESGSTHRIKIGHDPSRIDVAELELTFEEFLRDELIHARRLRLDQVETDRVRGEPEFTVEVPSVGHGLWRKVTLYSNAGELLDMTSRFRTVEQVSITVGIIGESGPGATSTSGLDAAATAQDRDALIANAAFAWSEWLGLGVDQQVFHPGADVRTAVKSRLSAARGELLIADRYFGTDPSDWDVTDDVSVAVRAVVSLGAPPDPPRNHVDVRWLRPKKLTMHGRYYLWQGGGLHVDNSPAGFSKGVTTVTRIDPFASERLMDIFETSWWTHAKATPPQSVKPNWWADRQRKVSKRLQPARKKIHHVRNKSKGPWNRIRKYFTR